MKKFVVNPKALEKFLHQNKATIIDAFDGCLLDNYLCETKRGVMAIYERFVNEWTSSYTVIFAADSNDRIRVCNDFYSRMDEVLSA